MDSEKIAALIDRAHDKILPVEKREGRHRGGREPPGGAESGSIYLNLVQFGSIWFG